MLQVLDAETYFGGARPPGLPDDAPAPDESALFERALALARESARYPLGLLRDILERENRRLDASPAALDAIRSIGPGAVFVVAGQQAGLFGGPLYTLYKALHAVRLAARIRETAGVNAVPVFWTASDDHDFEEVRSLDVRAADGVKFRVEYSPVSYLQGAPVGEIVLDDGVTDLVDILAGRLPRGDRAAAYLDILRRTWKPGARWSDAFSAQMAALLSERGLVMLDPRWPGIKDLFASIPRMEIEKPLASSALVNEAADRSDSGGERRIALRRPDGATNLFLESDGVRSILRFANGAFESAGRRFSPDKLLRLLYEDPGRFSPAAALRPVCQDALMPVAALIGGPGERAYLSQVRPLYGLFGVDGSIVWPRASFTIMDQRSIRTAEKGGFPPADFFLGADHLRARIAEESFPPDIDRALSALERAVEAGFEETASVVAALDPTLAASFRKEKGKALHSVETMRERALRAHKARTGMDAARIGAAAHFLLPDGVPQERRFGADAAFILLGREGIDELAEFMSPGEEKHRMIAMGG